MARRRVAVTVLVGTIVALGASAFAVITAIDRPATVGRPAQRVDPPGVAGTSIVFGGTGSGDVDRVKIPLAAGTHVATCSPITYATNPPTSGAHYPIWARYRSYPAPVPRGFWVHDLEHGAVVITYNCPDGCADDVAALEAFLAARPADPTCTAPVANRFVVTPDPLLDTRFAASAWGFALRADCFDLGALGTFIDDHYARAPEDLCGDGVDPLDPQNGFPSPCP